MSVEDERMTDVRDSQWIQRESYERLRGVKLTHFWALYSSRMELSLSADCAAAIDSWRWLTRAAEVTADEEAARRRDDETMVEIMMIAFLIDALLFVWTAVENYVPECIRERCFTDRSQSSPRKNKSRSASNFEKRRRRQSTTQNFDDATPIKDNSMKWEP